MSQARKLNVFYEDSLVGVLHRDDELIYSFQYSDQWLRGPNSFQLSLAMPFRDEAFGNKVTLSFFENLLPEGESRDAIEKSQHLKGTFDFLKQFGRDCAGAVMITAEEKSPYSEKKHSLVKIELEQIFKAIEDKRSVAEVIASMNPGYLSIAGAQDKFAAIYQADEFYLPSGGSPTTHIVKVPIHRSGVKESVYNEYYCMKLANRVGLHVAHCFVRDDKKHPLYITQRYDRTHEKTIKRIHQQDFCQAQGIVSEEKYEATGGPTLKDNYELIKSNVTVKQRSQALFQFLDWTCFNLLIGNNDSHSKNLSFLLKDGKIELAPFYDLLCTAIYPNLKQNFSFLIGDRDNSSQIGKNQLEMVDQNLGIKLGVMSERMLLMREKLLENKDGLADELSRELPHAKIIKRISQLIGNRCKSFLKQSPRG
jgi:serine/threonine-protein kinase HipA